MRCLDLELDLDLWRCFDLERDLDLWRCLDLERDLGLLVNDDFFLNGLRDPPAGLLDVFAGLLDLFKGLFDLLLGLLDRSLVLFDFLAGLIDLDLLSLSFLSISVSFSRDLDLFFLILPPISASLLLLPKCGDLMGLILFFCFDEGGGDDLFDVAAAICDVREDPLDFDLESAEEMMTTSGFDLLSLAFFFFLCFSVGLLDDCLDTGFSSGDLELSRDLDLAIFSVKLSFSF